jgi:alcohol dehydrogenase, propanol-preferring
LLLVGFGSSAHIVIQIARARGHQVFVVTRSANHIHQAKALGATWAGADFRLNYTRHLYQERELRSVTANTRDDARKLLAETAAANVRPQTTLYPLEGANRALCDMKQSRTDGTPVLIVRAGTG